MKNLFIIYLFLASTAIYGQRQSTIRVDGITYVPKTQAQRLAMVGMKQGTMIYQSDGGSTGLWSFNGVTWDSPISGFTVANDQLNLKVDKVAGRQLSTNDYTTTEQLKLMAIASGATVNSTDANLRDRTTHTGLQAISTVTLLQTNLDAKVLKEVPLIIFVGESNSEGRALNTSATATELAIRPNLQIWNVTNIQFESLQIGVNNVWNNNVQFQTNKALWHGWELELANRTADRIGFIKCFVVKAGQGGSVIGEWSQTTSPNYIEFVSRVTNAKNAIIAQGFTPKIYIFQSLGINDAISGTSATSFTSSLLSFHANIRSFLGASTPIIMTQIMENNAAYTTINNAIKAFAPPNTYNVDVTGLTLIDANHWDYAGMKGLCNRLLDVAVDVIGLPNNATGRKISIANSSFLTTAGNAVTNLDVSKTIIRPINAATDWQLAPLRIEAFGNSAKFGYGFYNTTTNRFVIGGVTSGVSNDDVEIAPLAKTFIKDLGISGTITSNITSTGTLNILGLTTASLINAEKGNFQLSPSNGTDQNNTIMRFGNNTNANSYGYISHDATDNTSYLGSVNNGVAHTNVVTAFIGTSKFGVGRKPTTNKFEVTGNSSFDGNVGVGTFAPISTLQSIGTVTVGNGATASAVGTMQLITGGASPTANRLTYGTDGTAWKFAIGKNQAGVVTDQFVIQSDGNVGVGVASPTSKLQVVGIQLFADNASATAGGLTVGAFYRTATGVLMVVF